MMEIFLLLLRQDPKKEKEHMEFESIHSMITGTLFDFNSTNWSLYNYLSNFPHFIGFPACPLVK